MFSKILIANRGEIACRVIQTARALGIRTIAVYSEADSQARHVKIADEAFLLGPAPSTESYLRSDKILEIAINSGAQAIHPGYGFLSENAGFAAACAKANIVFIGPPTGAIEAMGSKSAAKQIMSKAAVPLVPGYHDADQNDETLKSESEKCGYPQLLKAVAGGGGKGMRVVNNQQEFPEALESARREASNAFGNPDMLIERYLTQPRHVEIQVFCDSHGEGIYLAERDCSVQRRHQKVIEEAPAPGLSDAIRKAMGEAAVRAAQAIDYVGAGTVEFLYDTDGSYYFMEMNTRLQVEHPVTEMITGLDLVEWQLRIAAGEALPLTQDQVTINGHSLEVRVYAEDPDNDFLPATGVLHYLKTPQESPHVRVDTGVLQGDEVSVYYDPMIAKLIVWDSDRERAINRMVSALEDYKIAGLTTNLSFLHKLADSQPFRDCLLDTGFIETHQTLLFPDRQADLVRWLTIAAVCFAANNNLNNINPADSGSPFNNPDSWRLNSSYARPLTLTYKDGQSETTSRLTLHSNGIHYSVILHGHAGDNLQASSQKFELQAQLQDDHLTVTSEGHRQTLEVCFNDDQLTLFAGAEQFSCKRHKEDFNSNGHDSENSLNAPMNGAVVAVLVEAGAKVSAGDTLIIMEAMKMEHSLKAPHDGTVAEIFYQKGELVDDGAELIALEAED